MKANLYLTLAAFVISSLSLNAQCIERARNYGGPQGKFSGEYGWSVVHANDGSYYVSGRMGLYRDTAYTINFDGISLEKPYDADKRPYHFLLKYSAGGTASWGKVIAKSIGDDPNQLAIDKDGNIFFAFSFVDTFVLNGNHISLGGTDLAVAKFSPDGTIQWVQTGGGSNSEYQEALTTDQNGNVYVGGIFSDTLQMGSVKLTYSGNTFNYNGYVLKLDSSGKALWGATPVKYKAVNSFGIRARLAANEQGALYWSGYFKDTLTVGDKTIYTQYNDKVDGFISKLDASTGNLMWLNGIHGKGQEYINGLTMLPSGSVLLSGHFTDTVSFASTQLISKGNRDGFIVSYNPDGTVAWAKSGGSKKEDRCFNTTYTNGAIYVAAYADSLAEFGTVQGDTGAHMMVVKFDETGEAKSVITGGKADVFYHPAISVKGEQVIMTGTFSNNLKPTPFGNDTITATGYRDMFIWHACDTTAIIDGIATTMNEDAVINAYPNPFSDYTVIKITNDMQNAMPATELSLTDITGHEIMQILAQERTFTLHKGSLSAGCYFFRITSANRMIGTGKLFIQ